MKFVTKPIPVEAIQWTGHNSVEVGKFLGLAGPKFPDNEGFGDRITIETPGGDKPCDVNDWLVKSEGVIRVVQDDIFGVLYEANTHDGDTIRIINGQLDCDPNRVDATTFPQRLANIINYHSMEGRGRGGDTPDYILADFLCEVLAAWDKATNRRTDFFTPARVEAVDPPNAGDAPAALPLKPINFAEEMAKKSFPAPTEALYRDLGACVAKLREMVGVQGSHGNWNCNEYMRGMFNGMEFALSIFEEREPLYRDAPERYLDDKPPTELPKEVEALCANERKVEGHEARLAIYVNATSELSKEAVEAEKERLRIALESFLERYKAENSVNEKIELILEDEGCDWY